MSNPLDTWPLGGGGRSVVDYVIVIEPIPDSCSSLQLFLLVHRLLLD